MQYQHRVYKRNHLGTGMIYDLDYSGTDTLIERINSSIPIKENITVEVLHSLLIFIIEY